MTISFVGSATGSVVNSASFDITLPSMQEDDVVIVVTAAARIDDINMGVNTAGYVELCDLYANHAVDINFAVNWKRMGATPDSTVNCIGSTGSSLYDCVGIAYVLRGVDSTTAIDVITTTATGISSAIPDAPSNVPVTSGTMAIAVGGGTRHNMSVTAPSGYTNQVLKSGSAVYQVSAAIASKVLGAAVPEDPSTWTDWATSTTDSWAAATIVLRPDVVPLIIGIPSANLLVTPYSPTLVTWGTPPEFEPADLVPSPEPGDLHKPCGHWATGTQPDPEWDFTEQPSLPFQYHEHPVKPEICGHWHKPPEAEIPCIEYVGEIRVPFSPETEGLYNSGDAMLFHTDGFIYGGASSEGTIFRIEPDKFQIDNQTTFSSTDVSSIKQLEFYDGMLYALVLRDGYTGNWIQKISIPTGSESFELVDEPMWAGSVVVGTDEKIYGSVNSLNMSSSWIDRHTPITGGNWEGNWEQLPDDYPYDIEPDVSVFFGGVTSGAELINFRIMPHSGFIFNNGPSSSFLDRSAFISSFEFDGTRNHVFSGYTIQGPNEIVLGPNGHELVLLRSTSAFGNLTLRHIDTNDLTSVDHAITGLLDADGVVRDNGIYHKRTVWHPANNLIYSFHGLWSDWDNRIIAVNSGGELIHQFAWPGVTGKGSFVILGDYVYVWQDGITGNGHVSAIVKLTLELEFVCIEDCLGGFVPVTKTYYEEGRQIVTDGKQFLFNFAQAPSTEIDGMITKWQVRPVAPTFDDCDAMWDFTKQPDKF